MAGTYDGRFEAIIDRILDDEGGYVNHPLDRGGPTKYGVTAAFYEEAFGEPADQDTIKNLTRNDARRAYHKVIWQKYGVHMLPSEVQELMFDWITMSGPSTPIKFLQRRVGAHPDGIIGPETRRAVRTKLMEVSYREFHNRFVNDIIRFLIRIAKRDPTQTVFLEGWFNRFCIYYNTEGVNNDTNHKSTDYNASHVQSPSGRSERSVRDVGSDNREGKRSPKVVVEKGKGKDTK